MMSLAVSVSSWTKLRCCAAALGFAFVANAAYAVDLFVIQFQGRRALVVQDEKASPKFPDGGHIKDGDAARFERVMREAMPVAEVLFNSFGGSEKDGLAIGRAIRSAGLSTRIPKGATCASACADAFMGGIARRVDEGGRYGIHMPTFVGSDPERIDAIFLALLEAFDTKKATLDRPKVRRIIQHFEKESAKAAARWSAYVLEMGASPRIVDVGTESSASDMNWLSRRQMIDLNVINVDN